jgi:hypothetical protein
MGQIEFPETSVRNYHYSLRDNPEKRSAFMEGEHLSLCVISGFRCDVN